MTDGIECKETTGNLEKVKDVIFAPVTCWFCGTADGGRGRGGKSNVAVGKHNKKQCCGGLGTGHSLSSNNAALRVIKSPAGRSRGGSGRGYNCEMSSQNWDEQPQGWEILAVRSQCMPTRRFDTIMMAFKSVHLVFSQFVYPSMTLTLKK